MPPFVKTLLRVPARTLFAYCFLVLGNRFVSPRSSGVTRLFGRRIAYPSRANLHGMFSEVFMHENYAIAPTDTPLTILDCGSNIGLSLLYFRMQAPQARIIGFEPHPETFATLLNNVTENALNIELHQVALAKQDGEATFFSPRHDAASQSASLSKEIAVRAGDLVADSVVGTVRTVRLSTFITGLVDILKLDIEGAEGEVLEELAESGALARVKTIFAEYHLTLPQGEASFAGFLDTLERSGFTYAIASSVALPFSIAHAPRAYSYKIVAWRA